MTPLSSIHIQPTVPSQTSPHIKPLRIKFLPNKTWGNILHLWASGVHIWVLPWYTNSRQLLPRIKCFQDTVQKKKKYGQEPAWKHVFSESRWGCHVSFYTKESSFLSVLVVNRVEGSLITSIWIWLPRCCDAGLGKKHTKARPVRAGQLQPHFTGVRK